VQILKSMTSLRCYSRSARRCRSEKASSLSHGEQRRLAGSIPLSSMAQSIYYNPRASAECPVDAAFDDAESNSWRRDEPLHNREHRLWIWRVRAAQLRCTYSLEAYQDDNQYKYRTVSRWIPKRVFFMRTVVSGIQGRNILINVTKSRR
jgi:hypothetical protein